MDDTSLDINQIQWIQPLWFITSSVITIITLTRAVHLNNLHYCLDHPKSHYFDQKGKLQLWVAIFLHSSEIISPHLFVPFLPPCQLFCNFQSLQFKKKILWLCFPVKYDNGFKDICADCNLWGSL
jgi:hypothetical protein